MQVRLHEVKDQVDILVILGPDQVLKADDVGVAVELAQEDDFAEGALCVGCVLEGIEHLLYCYDRFGLLVQRLPHHPVGALPQFLHDLVLPQDVGLYFFGHFVIISLKIKCIPYYNKSMPITRTHILSALPCLGHFLFLNHSSASLSKLGTLILLT